MSQNNAGGAPTMGGPFEMIRPQHIQSIPILSDVDKQRYQAGLEKLWTTVNTHGPESEMHQKAVAKIKEVSKDLMVRLARSKAQGRQGNAQAAQQQNAQAGQMGQNQQGGGQEGVQQTNGQAQQSQAQQQQQQQALAQAQAQQQQQGQAQAANQQAQAQGQRQNTVPQQGQQQAKLSAQAEDYLRKLEVWPPQNMMQNTPEFQQYKQKLLSALHKCLLASDRYGSTMKDYAQREQQLQQSGQSLPADQAQQREQLKVMLGKAKAEFDRIKSENERNKQLFLAKRAQMAAAGGDQNAAAGQTQAGDTQAQGQAPPQKQAQIPQQPQAQAQGQIQQSTQQPMRLPGQQGQPGQDAQQQNAQGPQQNSQFTSQSSTQPSSNTPASQAQQQQPTQVAQQQQAPQMPQQQQPRPQPVPQQQQQAFPAQTQQPGQPQPLSHQAAISAIARTYSDAAPPQVAAPLSRTGTGTGTPTPTPQAQTSTPFAAAPSASSSTGASNIGNQKMPIPSKLGTPPIQPVQMAASRPTLGPGPQGLIGQPGFQKPPGFTLEGDEGRVLSKKKLDELVRQVTGGGEGLTPEVEEAVLEMADDFVDDLLTSACRLAKIRPNSTLDIRDIQIILERNYNIRIPGYSLDEVRTVRKFQPAQGWTQKMNAVQAAKVMGKGDN